MCSAGDVGHHHEDRSAQQRRQPDGAGQQAAWLVAFFGQRGHRIEAEEGIGGNRRARRDGAEAGGGVGRRPMASGGRSVCQMLVPIISRIAAIWPICTKLTGLLFYATPSAGNTAAQARFRLNRFTVTRQLRYSLDDTAHALDPGLFINGLPVATFELKNSLTKQTVADAVEQYRRDRDPRERLFEFGRCIAHFAVDDAQVEVTGQPVFNSVIVVTDHKDRRFAIVIDEAHSSQGGKARVTPIMSAWR